MLPSHRLAIKLSRCPHGAGSAVLIMAGCSGIQSDGLAEGGGLTSRAMST